MTKIALFLSLCCLLQGTEAQPVSGVWHGRVDAGSGILKASYRVELKLARQGDSLFGTSYYLSGRRDFSRFPVKGYFNPYDGTVTWWHAETRGIDDKGRPVTSPIGSGTAFVTDFNCPGGEDMSLDGELKSMGDQKGGRGQPVHFEKVPEPIFRDEWDDALNDPSMDLSRLMEKPGSEEPDPSRKPIPVIVAEPPKTIVGKKAETEPEKPVSLSKEERKPATPFIQPGKPTPESLFESRRSRLIAEVPLKGDTLELNFYDHAEIDGDTVSIFHNGSLLKKHLLLKAEPFTLRFHIGSLPDRNDFTMVAENLGRIPPNTSLLIAYVDGVRHEARLESTENESASIRFEKPKG